MQRDPHPMTTGRLQDSNGSDHLSSRAAIEAVRAAVSSWEGVRTQDHQFGGSNSGLVVGSWAICMARSPTCPFHTHGR
jgi:hypothetical protein